MATVALGLLNGGTVLPLLPLIALGLGVVCALTSRVLLLIAAVRISAAWAIGVLFPFGPLFFRLNYPEQARSSMMFRYATLAFFAIYIIKGQPMSLKKMMPHQNAKATPGQLKPGDMLYYGTETAPATTTSSTTKTATTKTTNTKAANTKAAVPAAPTPILNLPERRAANDQELIRLRTWYDALKLRKRDLLHSDVQGNKAYEADLKLYNDALAKAMVERNTLDAAPR